MVDSNDDCMNVVGDWRGAPTEDMAVDSSCVANDTLEEFWAFSGGGDVNVLENLHYGWFMNIETNCVVTSPPCLDGDIHFTNYQWKWSTPGT